MNKNKLKASLVKINSPNTSVHPRFSIVLILLLLKSNSLSFKGLINCGDARINSAVNLTMTVGVAEAVYDRHEFWHVCWCEEETAQE